MYEWVVSATNTIVFVMVDSNGTEVTGLGTGFTIALRKLGGAFSTGGGTKSEISDGWYQYVATTGEADTLGLVAIKVTGAGCVQQNLLAVVKPTEVSADVTKISGDAVAADNFETMLDGTGGKELSLGKLNIVNTAGDAIVASSTGGNGNGVNISGNGSGEGITVVGGTMGHGAYISGGATSGDGIRVGADGGGVGMQVIGAGNNAGIWTRGSGSGNGFDCTGGDTGNGIDTCGGAVSGHGIRTRGSTEGHGILAIAYGTSKNGIYAQSQATGGHGIEADGYGAGDGLKAVAGATGYDINADIQGNLSGAVGSLGTTAKSDVNAEIVDALNVDTYAEPGQGAPDATTSLVVKIGYLYKSWRNKKTHDGTTRKIYNDAEDVVDQKATDSDSGGTTTKGEVVSGP